MRKELPKVYDPRQVEPRIYQMWMDGGCFKAEPNPDKKPFSIVMPPPNVTGQLHMGHAMDATLQDILIRFKRMQGYEALWLPGTDHAGIATQIKVEEELRVKEGKTRYDLGREKFLERVWKWKEEYGNRIVQQQKKMGVSCDWSRARFTMDEGCSKAVRETFCELYDKGLIYKGSRIINWCPHCVTALSDAEVEYKEKPGHLWHIRYPIAGEEGRYVTVATTRPETMLGDTAVRYEAEGGRITALYTADHGDIAFEADSYVLATGSYFSQGLVAGMDGVREPLFGLDVACAADRGAWYDRDLFAAQPFELFGVKCDERLRGLRDGRAVENLYAIGAGLAGFNPVKEGCGAGVSMLTALAAAERILNE